jgi:hypothetical protein
MKLGFLVTPGVIRASTGRVAVLVGSGTSAVGFSGCSSAQPTTNRMRSRLNTFQNPLLKRVINWSFLVLWFFGEESEFGRRTKSKVPFFIFLVGWEYSKLNRGGKQKIK